MYKIVFMGTPEIAAVVLRRLAQWPEGRIELVVTHPDKPRGRKRVMQAPEVKVAAEALGLDVFQPERVRDEESVARIRAAQPDFLVVAAYGEFLPQSILKLPRIAPLNLHTSLLPAYRGASPIATAILEGEEVTGVTTMWISNRMDAGDILLQASLPILDGETTGELEARLAPLGAELMVRTLEEFRGNDDTMPRVVQDEQKATFAGKFSKEDGGLDWSKPALRLEREVRAFNPWPGSYTHFAWHDRRMLLKVHRAKALDAVLDAPAPGSLVDAPAGRLIVAAGEGTQLELLQVQPEGKRAMSAEEFSRGYPLSVGVCLGG